MCLCVCAMHMCICAHVSMCLCTLYILSSYDQVAVMGAKGAVSILYRGEKDVARIEQDYMEKFGNPFPAAVRGEEK